MYHHTQPGCVVIPSSSKMYVRLIESDFLWSSHKLVSDRIPPGGLRLPPSWRECAGPPSVWDLHVEEVKVPEQMRPQSASTLVARLVDVCWMVQLAKLTPSPSCSLTNTTHAIIPILFLKQKGPVHSMV